eukprot:scaffold41143_cov65-Phaeocystis_antarctica.AAC.3
MGLSQTARDPGFSRSSSHVSLTEEVPWGGWRRVRERPRCGLGPSVGLGGPPPSSLVTTYSPSAATCWRNGRESTREPERDCAATCRRLSLISSSAKAGDFFVLSIASKKLGSGTRDSSRGSKPSLSIGRFMHIMLYRNAGS